MLNKNDIKLLKEKIKINKKITTEAIYCKW